MEYFLQMGGHPCFLFEIGGPCMTVDYFNDPNRDIWFWGVVPLLSMLCVVHILAKMPVSNQFF